MRVFLFALFVGLSGCNNQSANSNENIESTSNVDLETSTNSNTLQSDSSENPNVFINSFGVAVEGSAYRSKLQGEAPQILNCENELGEIFLSDELYDNIRIGILKAGYNPYQGNEYHECLIHEDMSDWQVDYCKNERPEMEMCASSGTAPCRWTWSKDSTLLRVYTNYEDLEVASVECSKL